MQSVQRLRGRNPERPLRFYGNALRMRAFFYIDGFNLYKSRLQRLRQFRWLNIHSLAEILVPTGTTVDKVNFYTAYVSGKIDPDAVQKQQAYMAALRTLPTVEIHSGNFNIGNRWVKLVHPPDARPNGYVWNNPFPEFVFASIPQEKGSDVKLGVHLVRDAFQGNFDVAYVITNDTDLVEPIRIVTGELGKPVVIVAPIRQRHWQRPVPATPLRNAATNVAYIDDTDLANAQFPDQVAKGNGKVLTKPVDWV